MWHTGSIRIKKGMKMSHLEVECAVGRDLGRAATGTIGVLWGGDQ